MNKDLIKEAKKKKKKEPQVEIMLKLFNQKKAGKTKEKMVKNRKQITRC